MKLEEVCEAFIQGKNLVNKYGMKYYKVEEKYVQGNIGTSYPFIYPECVEILDEYPLTFLEAIISAQEGGNVVNKLNPKDIYKYKGGTIVDKYNCPCLGYEQKSDWKVVK